MALSDARKEQSIQLVDELKSQIAAGVFDFKGTREEVAEFIKDIKMRVNLMTVEEIYNEFELSEEEEQETPVTVSAHRLEAGMHVMHEGQDLGVVEKVFPPNTIGLMRVLFNDQSRMTFHVGDLVTLL